MKNGSLLIKSFEQIVLNRLKEQNCRRHTLYSRIRQTHLSIKNLKGLGVGRVSLCSRGHLISAGLGKKAHQ